MEASSCLITPASKPSCYMRVVDSLSSRRRTARRRTIPARSLSVTCSGSDWRTFRARLVAAETAPAADVGDKWAHPLHVPEKGCLLLATSKLEGVHIFERTIILILAASPTRLSGVILNRPSLMSISSTSAAAFAGRPLFFGGPLKEEGLFLYKGESGSGVFDEVMEGLYYGTRESVGCAAELVKRGAVVAEDLVFFDGYCGWERIQLDDEVRAGYWSIVACSSTVVEAVAKAAGKEGGGRTVWEEVVGLAGGRRML